MKGPKDQQSLQRPKTWKTHRIPPPSTMQPTQERKVLGLLLTNKSNRINCFFQAPQFPCYKNMLFCPPLWVFYIGTRPINQSMIQSTNQPTKLLCVFPLPPECPDFGLFGWAFGLPRPHGGTNVSTPLGTAGHTSPENLAQNAWRDLWVLEVVFLWYVLMEYQHDQTLSDVVLMTGRVNGPI